MGYIQAEVDKLISNRKAGELVMKIRTNVNKNEIENETLEPRVIRHKSLYWHKPSYTTIDISKVKNGPPAALTDGGTTFS